MEILFSCCTNTAFESDCCSQTDNGYNSDKAKKHLIEGCGTQ